MSTPTPTPRFRLGRLLMTVGARDALVEAGQTPDEFIRRHWHGDWGEVSEHDRAENELSVKEGFRILSAYRTAKGVCLWVVTEGDRSVTAILLHGEY